MRIDLGNERGDVIPAGRRPSFETGALRPESEKADAQDGDGASGNNGVPAWASGNAGPLRKVASAAEPAWMAGSPKAPAAAPAPAPSISAASASAASASALPASSAAPAASAAAPQPASQPVVQPPAAPVAPAAAASPAVLAESREISPSSGHAPPAESPRPVRRKRPKEVHAAPAGVISRNIARLVDLVCNLGLAALTLVLAEAVTGEKLLTPERLKMLALPLAGLFFTLTFAYTTFFHTLYGRTPGKWVTGIRVLDETGNPPRFGRSALRMVLAFVSTLPLFAGVAIALFSRRRQTLYDKLTGTYVVRLIEVR